MSDERPVFARWRFSNAGMLGNKLLIFELFEAKYWRLKQGMPVFPSPRDCEAVDWSRMYRVRVNGRWFGEKKYSFFTLPQIAAVAERMLESQEVILIEV